MSMEVEMADDMVMRSIYVRPLEDAQLRQLAHNLNVTKSDLIRSAIRIKLSEWLGDNSGKKALKDVREGLREVRFQEQVKRARPKLVVAEPAGTPPVKMMAAKKAAVPRKQTRSTS
jgi:hypothetical protein